jgi:hypothetical protein
MKEREHLDDLDVDVSSMVLNRVEIEIKKVSNGTLQELGTFNLALRILIDEFRCFLDVFVH